MSRIGKKPIEIPSGVTLTLDGQPFATALTCAFNSKAGSGATMKGSSTVQLAQK